MSTEPLPAADPDDELATRLRASRQLEHAPDGVLQRAFGVWRPPAAAPACAAADEAVGAGAILRRLVAALRFDSVQASPVALGLRAGGGTRQLLYFSEGRDIDLRISSVATSGGERWRISGQVLGPDTTGMAQLRSGETTRTAAWSELAEFSFTDLAAGRFELTLRGADWELELPPIDVPA